MIITGERRSLSTRRAWIEIDTFKDLLNKLIVALHTESVD